MIYSELPRRKKIRLEEYDYSNYGAYFITVCTQNTDVQLSRISEDNFTILTDVGNIVDAAIQEISCRYPAVILDKYCIMPDHIHIILFINSIDNHGRQIAAPTVSRIIGNMKRAVSMCVGYSIWQKSFYDRIIRNQQEYDEVWKYIDDNPLKWRVERCRGGNLPPVGVI